MNIQRELDVLSAAFAARLREKLAHPELPAEERTRVEAVLAKLERPSLVEEYDGAPMCRCETCTPGNYTCISRD